MSVALACAGAWGAEQPRTPLAARPGQTAQVKTSEPRIVERWQDGRVWQKTVAHTNPDGSVVLRTNRWTELGTGMHYRDRGQWKESRAEIAIVPDGAEAVQGAHKVHFAGNLNTVGSITITSRDGKTLRSHVLGLGYTDLASGKSILIARIRDSIGQLFPPNQVVYPDAFSGLLADVRYSYTLSRFEQDILLYEQPAPPASYGLNNETTVLEVWTEFDQAPDPVKTAQNLDGLSDETISFGKMRLMRGSAFALDAPTGRLGGAPVGKTWLKDQGTGRSFLIESVQRGAVMKQLEKLPAQQAALPGRDGSRLALLNKMDVPPAGLPRPVQAAQTALNNQAPNDGAPGTARPEQSLAGNGPSSARRSKLSQPDARQGLVLDYVLTEAEETDYTFQADTSYLLSCGVEFYGTITFEGGAVIKFATTNEGGTLISAYGPIIFQTDQYRPVIFTSQNDRTVGQDFYAAGFPTNYLGAIAHSQVNTEFKHLRISYADYGLHSYALRLHDAQFTHCGKALYTEFGAGQIDNVLFYDNTTVFGGSRYTNTARQVTVNQCATLCTDWYNVAHSRVALTNSLLVNVTTNGGVSLTTNCTVTTTGAIFQTVGAGAHYLADGSPYRDAGTTNLPASLAASLKKTTTYPPLVIVPYGSYYGVSQTLTPRAGRDTDLPDLGYHYDPIDYALALIYLTNATIQVDPGTAIAMFNPTNVAYYGVSLAANAKFLSHGRAEAKVNITHYPTVQEMANTNWNGPMYSLLYAWDSPVGAPELTCRFTDFSVLGQSPSSENGDLGTPLVYSGSSSFAWRFTDCQFHGGLIYNYGAPFFFTNCLFNRTYAYMEVYDSGTNYLYNSTWQGGTLAAYFLDPSNAKIYDTLFVGTLIGADVTSSNIGYVGTGYRLNPTNISDRVLSNLTFQTGPLGSFYVPTNTALYNAGSRNATNAGLSHYTMFTNNAVETNTMVDIGFHYVSTDANGTPLDYDGDGIPDYWEDTNGNGSYDVGAGEADWKSYNSANSLKTSPSLKVFTPLK